MPVDKDMIRDQDNTAVVEATFQLSGQQRETASQLLEALGIPKIVHPVSLNGKLVIRREIQHKQPNSSSTSSSPHSFDSERAVQSEVNSTAPAAAGSVRSTAFINAAAAPLRNVRALGASLVDVNSQNAAAALRSPAAQLALLDRLARCAPLATEFSAALARLQVVWSRLEELGDFEDDSLRHNEQAMLERIDALEVVAGEEGELQTHVARLNVRMGAVQAALEVHATIGERAEDRSLLGLLAVLLRRMANLRQRVDLNPAGDTSGHIEDAATDTPNTTLSTSGQDDVGEGAQRESLALLEDAAANLYQVEGLLEGSKGKLEEFVQSLEHDADTHARAKARLQALNALLADTDCTTTHELLACAADTRALLADWDSVAEELPQLREEEEKLMSALVDTGTRLSSERRRASGHLRQAVEGSLQQLAMAQSRFDVRISWEASCATSTGVGANSMHVPLVIGDEAEALGEAAGQIYKAWATGLDKVEFLLAAGPAEPLQPLQNVASGGESARVMLALKAAPSESPSVFSGDPTPERAAQGAAHPPQSAAEQPSQGSAGVIMIEPQAEGAVLYPWSTVHGGAAEFDGDTGAAERALGALASPVLVLDEVDAGTGARLGGSVAQLLRRLAASNGQVLCVSHVPQVAAHAQRHILVEKSMHEDRPHTSFRVLETRSERVAEVASMLGLEVDAAIAEDMLDSAARS